MERDTIDVTPIQEPDPNWKFRDKQNHAHVWRMGNDIPPYVPTIRYVEDSPGTEDHPAIGHHECRICGEHVEVGFMATTVRKHVAGLRSYFINEEEVSKEKYDKIYAEVVKRCG
jgi:hypothetical protein